MMGDSYWRRMRAAEGTDGQILSKEFGAAEMEGRIGRWKQFIKDPSGVRLFGLTACTGRLGEEG